MDEESGDGGVGDVGAGDSGADEDSVGDSCPGDGRYAMAVQEKAEQDWQRRR